jgi:hypothetical protein
MLFSVAKGVADGQRQLDLSSIQTLIELSRTLVQIIPEITEIITPEPMHVHVTGDTFVDVTGATVSASAAEPVRMTALQAGLTPTFYQFTEANMQLKLSLQVREVEETDTTGTRRTFYLFGSNVNFRTQNTFSYSVDGTSEVTATLRPVPTPARLSPQTITVNALGPRPVVSITP